MSIKPEKTKDGIKLRDTSNGNLAGSVSTVGKDSLPTASPISLTESKKTSLQPQLDYAKMARKAFLDAEERARLARAVGGIRVYRANPELIPVSGVSLVSRDFRMFTPESRFETFDANLVNQNPIPYHKVFSNFPNFVTSATDALFASRPSQLSHEEREVAFKSWMNALAEGYGIDNPTFNWYSERNQGVSFGGGYYQPSTHRLYVDEDIHSVTTFLHEYRHALQHLGAEVSSNDVEIDARAWSLSLYYTVRPELLTRLVKENRIFHIDPSLL